MRFKQFQYREPEPLVSGMVTWPNGCPASLALAGGLVFLLIAPFALAAKGDARANAKLEVQLLLLADAPEPRLRLLVTNRGEGDVPRDQPRTAGNQLVLLCPSGRVAVWRTHVHPAEPWKLPMIRPGETASWDLSIPQVFANERAGDEGGVFRFYVDYGGTKSREVLLFRAGNAGNGKAGRRDSVLQQAAEIVPESPKSVLHDFLMALDGAKRGGVGLMMRVRPEEDTELRVVESVVWCMELARDLRQKMGEEFGAAGQEACTSESGAERVREIVQATVEYSEHFEEAVIRHANWSVRMRRDGPFWLLSPRSFIRDGRAPVELLQERRAGYRALLKQLDEGKFRGLEEAERAIHHQLNQTGGSLLNLCSR